MPWSGAASSFVPRADALGMKQRTDLQGVGFEVRDGSFQDEGCNFAPFALTSVWLDVTQPYKHMWGHLHWRSDSTLKSGWDVQGKSCRHFRQDSLEFDGRVLGDIVQLWHCIADPLCNLVSLGTDEASQLVTVLGQRLLVGPFASESNGQLSIGWHDVSTVRLANQNNASLLASSALRLQRPIIIVCYRNSSALFSSIVAPTSPGSPVARCFFVSTASNTG